MFLESITCNPSIYTMDHPDLTVSNYMENSICLTLYAIGYFKIMTSFSIFRQHRKKIKKNLSKDLNTFENIMENGAFQRRQKE